MLNKFKFWIYRKLVTKVYWVNLYNLVGSEGHSNTRADVHWALHKDIAEHCKVPIGSWPTGSSGSR